MWYPNDISATTELSDISSHAPSTDGFFQPVITAEKPVSTRNFTLNVKHCAIMRCNSHNGHIGLALLSVVGMLDRPQTTSGFNSNQPKLVEADDGPLRVAHL